MKKLNELGGLRAFRVDTITFGPEADSEGNAVAHIAIPENFLPIALTGKIGALLIPATGSIIQNPTQPIEFSYNFSRGDDGTSSDMATWTGWSASIGERGYTTPELRINTDQIYNDVHYEGFTIITINMDTSISTAKPDIPLYIIGVTTSLNQES